jgi:pyruvyl transferase EpsO
MSVRATLVDRSALSAVRAELDRCLRLLLDGATDVALLDIPNHCNFGDGMILSGELAALRRLGVRVRSVSDMCSYDPDQLRSLPADTVMLLHGGGNFGDLYVDHEEFRRTVLADLPDRRIVLLPQSARFVDQSLIEPCRRALEAHPDLTLTWRDRSSLEFAERQFPNCRSMLVPDGAFGLVPLRRPWWTFRERTDVLILARRDIEALGDRPLSVEASQSVDWENVRVERAQLRVIRSILWRLGRRDGELADRLRGRALRRQATIYTRAAARIIASAELIVTDRLHAIIAALLLDSDVIAVHSLDHKAEHLLSTWFPDERVTILDSAVDALVKAGVALRAEGQG